MAALPTTALTLLDWAKRLDPDGTIAPIVEILNQTNEILDDMLWIEGNLPTGHQSTIRTGLPSVYYRLLNAGVPPSKSHTTQITENTAMLEAYSQVDVALAKLGGEGRVQGVRFSEARAFLEAMAQKFATTLFYGTAANPQEFVGLAARYSSTSAGNGANIIDGGGSGGAVNTSIWLVQWDPETVAGIMPMGSAAGVQHQDLGEDTVENAGGVTGNLMQAYRDRWEWKHGLLVKNWQHVVRIANIDTDNLVANTSPAALINLMEEAEERLPMTVGKRAFYMNRTVRRFLRSQIRADVKAGGGLTYENVAGKKVMFFGETPVRRVDALLNTESVVS